jgi:hypothetical protein
VILNVVLESDTQADMNFVSGGYHSSNLEEDSAASAHRLVDYDSGLPA